MEKGGLFIMPLSQKKKKSGIFKKSLFNCSLW